MNRFTYSIVLLIFSILCVRAQTNADAEKLITDLLTNAKSNAIKTNFELTVSEKNAVNSHIGSGTFIMKGNKFFLEMDEIKTWFDGKTQWSYLTENNEVSITEPTEKELGETNPMAILAAYKTKCLIRFSKLKSTQNHIVEMIPKVKNDDFTKVEVQINKTSGNLFSIKVLQKNGTTTLLTLSNYQKGIKVTDDIFVFYKTKFKGVMVNDLR
ncbi:MAG: outer membrane lipoprotein carrier protein LolA [Paludibacter sp.]|nr:outer membrane lipoprotein carrier protein LolA [Paludibacter sp.]